MLALLTVLVFAGAVAAGNIYQYTDENGNVIFTDDPGKVPEEKRPDMKQIKSDPPTERSVYTESPDRGRESPRPQRRSAPDGSDHRQPQRPQSGFNPDPQPL